MRLARTESWKEDSFGSRLASHGIRIVRVGCDERSKPLHYALLAIDAVHFVHRILLAEVITRVQIASLDTKIG